MGGQKEAEERGAEPAGKRVLFKGKKIGVLMGGLSEEREISLKSGGCVHKALVSLGYNAVTVDAGRDIAFKLVHNRIEVAFIALHGRYGEDGSIQGLLEIMDIPYTGSGVLASALAMDKVAAKVFLNYHGIPTPEFTVLKDGSVSKPALVPPFIVKPSCQGSTIGVSLVLDKGQYEEALKKAYGYGRTVVVERFIEGRELTVAVLDGRTLPVIEIIPKEGIFDFEAKYSHGASEFRVPADLKAEVLEEVKKAALSAYNLIGCSGAARVDIVLEDKSERPYVLEINTVPGMTEVSLLPRAALAMGAGYPALIEEMLFGAGVGKH